MLAAELGLLYAFASHFAPDRAHCRRRWNYQLINFSTIFLSGGNASQLSIAIMRRRVGKRRTSNVVSQEPTGKCALRATFALALDLVVLLAGLPELWRTADFGLDIPDLVRGSM
jgi:hypothetical protein